MGAGVPGLEGEDVDENGAGADEEDVQGGRVLEDPALGEGFFAEGQGEFGGGEPLGGSPLPGVGRYGDLGVQKLQAGRGVSDGDSHHVTAVLQTATEGRGDELQDFLPRGGVNGADGEVFFQAQRSGRIAKGGRRGS